MASCHMVCWIKTVPEMVVVLLCLVADAAHLFRVKVLCLDAITFMVGSMPGCFSFIGSVGDW